MRYLAVLFMFGITLFAAPVFGVPAGYSSDVQTLKEHASSRRAVRVAAMKARVAERRARRLGLNSSSYSFSSVSSESSASAVSSLSISLDPLRDTSIRSGFILLGETSPVIGVAKVFLYEEPMFIRSITVMLAYEAGSIESFLVYDQERRFLGRAGLDSSAPTNRNYKLTFSSSELNVPQRATRSYYVRAVAKSRQNGGVADQTIQISGISVAADGEWSTQRYTQVTDENFPRFITARGEITAVRNVEATTGPLVFGPARKLGSFDFSGRVTDGSARITPETLVFNIGQAGGAQVTNTRLYADGISEPVDCVTASSTITCSNIPDSYGDITDGPRRLTVYGDIAAPVPLLGSVRLNVSLIDPGSIDSPGAITWSDGSAEYSWVGMDVPVAEGTGWKY